MATEAQLKPVTDSVPKTGGAVAVGEDLAFQQAWWKFERVIWVLFALILIADISGLLGRGPLSKAEAQTADGSLHLKYERVERANTPSIMTLTPEDSAIQDGNLRLFVSDDVLKELGAQRIMPQPASSTLGNGGVTYSFPASSLPIVVQIELQPSFVGSHAFRMGIPGHGSIQRKILVLP